MKFGLGFPSLSDIPGGLLSGSFIRTLAARAEAVGFDAMYFTEHPIPSDAYRSGRGHDALDPFIGLSFVASATERLRLLTNLAVFPYHNPFLLAKTVATLDQLSGGRVTLGAGTGYLRAEYDALGIEFDSRNERFDRTLEVCRLAWAGESIRYERGEVVAVDVTARPVPAQPLVPIWIGGNSALTRRRVAQHAQGWIPLPNGGPAAGDRRTPTLETQADLERLLEDLREQCHAVGRTDPLDVMFFSLERLGPGDEGWDPARYRAELDAQAAVGVTWRAVNARGRTPEAVLHWVAQYGDDVIGPRRG